jgi:EAL domain-containing protein (putative c-di-GMP-specific phosphodiesterase class I)
MALNVSARQFRMRGLATRIADIVGTSGVPAHRVEIEITESTLMHDLDAALATMHQLRELGCTVAVDDFGTGHSSLAYMKRFPVSTLKIDRSFIAGLPDEPNDVAIVRAVIAMAEGLGVRVIAEGVETRPQLEHLAAQGCHEVQGFLISRPVEAATFQALMHYSLDELSVSGMGAPCTPSSPGPP